MGFDHGRDRSNYSSFVIFVIKDVLTGFCVLKFMLAVLPAFPFYLYWTAERVISVDFRLFLFLRQALPFLQGGNLYN